MFEYPAARGDVPTDIAIAKYGWRSAHSERQADHERNEDHWKHVEPRIQPELSVQRPTAHLESPDPLETIGKRGQTWKCEIWERNLERTVQFTKLQLCFAYL